MFSTSRQENDNTNTNRFLFMVIRLNECLFPGGLRILTANCFSVQQSSFNRTESFRRASGNVRTLSGQVTYFVKSIQEIINIFLYIIKYVNLIASQYFTEKQSKMARNGYWGMERAGGFIGTKLTINASSVISPGCNPANQEQLNERSDMKKAKTMLAL